MAVTPVDWQAWSTAAFLLAGRRRWPVLLLIDTAWAPAAADAQQHVFARPDVQAAIAEACVPIRVDADRRPDIADRYGLGHWPSVLFLTPEGHVLTGGTVVGDDFASRVRGVATAFAATDRRLAPPQAERGTASADPPPGLDDLVASLWAEVDERAGAFVRPGQPVVPLALFALAHASVTGDPDWARVAAATIDGLLDSPRWRPEEGLLCLPGHPAEGHALSRLEDQAEWIRLLSRAVRVEARDRWVEALDAAILGLLTRFDAGAGNWRPWTDAPALTLVDASARACRALLTAADTCRTALAERAIDGLEALAPVAYARGSGVFHLVDARSRGPVLLTDAMLLGHALLDAHPWRDSQVYHDLAEEVLRTMVARLRDDSGLLRDRITAAAGAGQVGRLAEAVYPLEGNAEAARLAIRLAGTGTEWSELAATLVSGVTHEAWQAGGFGAPVGLAWHALGPSGSVMSLW